MATFKTKQGAFDFIYKFSTLKRLQTDSGKKIKDLMQNVSDLDPEAQLTIAYHGFKQADIDKGGENITPQLVEELIDDNPGLMMKCMQAFNEAYVSFYAIEKEVEKKH